MNHSAASATLCIFAYLFCGVVAQGSNHAALLAEPDGWIHGSASRSTGGHWRAVR